MKLAILTPLAALAVTACASVEVAETGEAVPESAVVAYDQPNGWPAEFSGRTVEIMTKAGVMNVVNLAPDGTMTTSVLSSGMMVIVPSGARLTTLTTPLLVSISTVRPENSAGQPSGWS